MRCTSREKHIRPNRRTRSVKPESDRSTATATDSNKPRHRNPVANTKNYLRGLAFIQNGFPVESLNENGMPNSWFDDSGWGYCSEEQLEEILLKHLEYLYTEAINRLGAMGYDGEVALRAILRNGYCYGEMDVMSNILHNSLAYLNCDADEVNPEESKTAFTDLRQLEEYSLGWMVCFLQKLKPHLSKGDAMWCLLMCDLHIGRASEIELPGGSSSGNGSESGLVSTEGVEGNDAHGGSVGVCSGLCKFHSSCGFGNGPSSNFPMQGFFSYVPEMALQREIECPKRFNLSPSMKSLLKRNVAAFAAGFRAKSKLFHGQFQSSSPGCLPGGDLSSAGDEILVKNREVSHHQYEKNQDVVNSVMNKFRDLNLSENAKKELDDEDEMILNLVHQIKELEKQVKERKEWAHQKALQAARKLSNDLTELKTLRMEREETQRLRKGKQTLEDTTMKRLSEMENALRKASGQVDRANAAVRKLETENAEIRAEMEASKLSASESAAACLEVAKREKKCVKRLLAWEKHKAQLQEDVAAEKQKISELQQELEQAEADRKESEAKWRQAEKVKETALAQLEEERLLKEAAEFSNKRKLEALHLKIGIDFQRYKDDLQRLEQEYARLKESAQSTEVKHQSNNFRTGKPNGMNPEGETIVNLPREFNQLDDSPAQGVSYDRECMICMKDEVSVVFLPCAHQVICASCNESHGKKGKATCPYCLVPIEQRIRVFGASS